MKKWWFGERKYIDEQKLAVKAKVRQDLKRLMEANDLEGYLNYVTLLTGRPLTPEERERHTALFTEQAGVHPSDAWTRS